MQNQFIEKLLMPEKGSFALVVKTAAVIIIFSIAAGFIVNLFLPKGYILVSKSAEKNKAIVYISSEEAKIKRDSGIAFIADARPEEEFAISHIAGAVNIPAIPDSVVIPKIKQNINVISDQKEVVLYCDGLSCGSSRILAEKLMSAGYNRHIYIIENGLPEWETRGFPVEKNTEGASK